MKISTERLKQIIKEEIENISGVIKEDIQPVFPKSALNRKLTYQQLLQPMVEYFGVEDPALEKLAIKLKHELFNQGKWISTINHELMLKYVGSEALEEPAEEPEELDLLYPKEEPEEPSLDMPGPGEGPEEELPLEPEEELELEQ